MGVKISALPSNSTPALTDVFPENHGNATYKATLSDVRDLFGIPELEDDLNDLAPAIVPTKSGNVVAFSDGADDMPIKSLAVNFEPVQDLNGYDRPWAGGGGKNLLPPLTSETKNGVTIAVADDGTVTVNGTATADTYFDVNFSANVSAGTAYYICMFNPVTSTSRLTIFIIGSAGNGQVNANYANSVFATTAAADNSFTRWRLRIPNGESYMNFVLRPMFQIGGETPTAYEPYENICPISGWTEANVTRAGRNLYAPTGETNSSYGVRWVSNLNGTITANGTATNTSFCKGVVLDLPAGTYTVCDFANNADGAINVQDATNWAVLATTSSENPKVFTLAERTSVVVRCRVPSGKTVTNSVFMPMLMVGEVTSIPSEFEEYKGETFNVTFPTAAGTVYGGVVDPIKGKLIVDRAIVDLGTLDWVYATTNIVMYTKSLNAQNAVAEMLCTAYPYAGISDSNGQARDKGNMTLSVYSGADRRIYIRDDRYTDAAIFKTAMSGIMLVYKLATPVEYTLSAQEITTLLGYNTIYADCGSIANVEYPADTKKYIDSRLDDIESRLAAQKSIIAGVETGMTATKNYSIGDLLIVGETLYKVTAAIANGGAITVGTSVAATTVAEQLIALASA